MKCSRPEIWASSAEQFESMGDKNTIGHFYSRGQHLYKFIWKPLDCLVTPTWPQFHFLEHHYGRLGVRVETFYTTVKFVFVFQSRIHVCQLLLTHLLLQLVHFGYQVTFTLFRVPERRENHWKTYAMLYNFMISFVVIICSVRTSIK